MQSLGQRRAMLLRDEWRCLSMSGPAEALVRRVLLICNEIPVVYTRTVVHPRSMTLGWPFLKALGVRPLGHSLFADPRVQRGDLEFTLLDAHHPLMRRAHDALGGAPVVDTARLPARRSVFRRNASAMLVTEALLPTLADFHPPR